MKTYTDREITSNGHNGTRYVALADLIAAGVLVAVPDGEQCKAIRIKIGSSFVWGGSTFRMYAGSHTQNVIEARELLSQEGHIFTGDTVVQPVSLLAIQEVVLTEEREQQIKDGYKLIANPYPELHDEGATHDSE